MRSRDIWIFFFLCFASFNLEAQSSPKCYKNIGGNAFVEFLFLNNQYFMIGGTDISKRESFGWLINQKGLESFLDSTSRKCFSVANLKHKTPTSKKNIDFSFVYSDTSLSHASGYLTLNKDLIDEKKISIYDLFERTSDCEIIKTKNGIVYRYTFDDFKLKNIAGFKITAETNYYKAKIFSENFSNPNFRKFYPKKNFVHFKNTKMKFWSENDPQKSIFKSCSCSQEILNLKQKYQPLMNIYSAKK